MLTGVSNNIDRLKLTDLKRLSHEMDVAFDDMYVSFRLTGTVLSSEMDLDQIRLIP
jgi:hypothetical protein